MSTSKHIDKICIAITAVTLVVTILFMCGGALGVSASPKTVKYESTVFDTSYVHKIDIVMNGWDEFIENCENEEYYSCAVVVDGVKHADVAIRAKGNTSLSSVRSLGSRRYSFKLEFDHYDDARTLDGLDKLCLNNLIQDNTMMKDFIVYTMMNDLGADSPLCSFAYLTVNGENWGLYLAVEGIEDSFLARSYGSDPGELYKPDSMSFGGGRGNGKGFNFDDFDFGDFDAKTEEKDQGERSQSESRGSFDPSGQFPAAPGGDGQQGDFDPSGQFPGAPGGDGQQGGFDPSGQFPAAPGGGGQQGGFDPSGQFPAAPGGGGQQGGFGGMGSDDVKLKYIDDDPDSYSNIFDNAKTDVSSADKKRLIGSLKKLSSYSDLEEILDTDEVLRYFVVHNFVCNGDSYTGSMIHNYYLYEEDGRLSMIPWDYNLAFGTFQGNNASGAVNSSVDSPVSGSLDDRPMVGWIFSDESYTEKYHELFASFIERWFSDGELEKLISDTADMIRPYVEKDPTKFCTAVEFEKGVDALSEFVSLRAEAVSRQLEVDDTAVDAGSLSLSDMGSMGRGTAGGDQDGREARSSESGRGGEAPRGSGGDQPAATPGESDGGTVPPSEDGAKDAAPSGKSEGAPDRGQRPSENAGGPSGRGFSPQNGQVNNSRSAVWLLLGGSVLVLAAGMIFAVKKKR